MFKPCLLRYPSEYLDAALRFNSISQALADYEKTSRALLNFGQKMQAAIHILRDGKAQEYPDYVLSVTRNGNVKKEKV